MPSQTEHRWPGLFNAGAGRHQVLYYAYAGALLLLTLYFLAATPIVPYDADLWFHLSHGRYIAEHDELPATSYFSFISPHKHWADYSWLFQVLIYKLYSLFGYHGLVLYRAAVCALSAVMVFLCLFSARRRRGEPLGYSNLMFALYLTLITPQFLSVRPFTISYALIPVFLYLLERRSKGVLWLVPLGLVWVNSHGVEYPVMILILGAYAIDLYARRFWQRRAFARNELRYLVFIAAAMGTVFLTPHGWHLIKVPFSSTRHTSLFIEELRQIEFSELFTFSFSPQSLTQLSLFNLIWIIALAALLEAAYRRRLVVSHVILLAGGIYLVTRAERLSAEFALLTVPLIASSFKSIPKPSRSIAPRLAAAMLLLLIPTALLANISRDMKRDYPLSSSGLPHGVTSFLRQVDAGGSIMNHPNVGGYFMWELFPRYQIFINLEVPFIFSDAEFLEIANAYYDGAALERFISTHDPPFIAVQSSNPSFQSLIRRHGEYVPVFFDDAQVLYVDREAHPETARDFGLRTVDPHALAAGRLIAPAVEDRQAFLAELERAHRVAPEVFATNRALAAILNLTGRFPEALPYAEAAVRGAPELADGYRLKGDALAGLGRFEEAVEWYQQALDIAPRHEGKILNKSLAMSLDRLGRTSEAYEALERGVDPFDPATSFDDLFHLGRLAFLAGEIEEARVTLELARVKLPAGDDVRRQQLEQALSLFE